MSNLVIQLVMFSECKNAKNEHKKLTWCLFPETVRLEMAQAASFLVENSEFAKCSIIGPIKPASMTA